MTLDEIMNLVTTSTNQDWKPVAFPDRMVYLHKANVELQLVMLYGEPGYHTEEFVAPWANCYSNPNARSYYADLYYGSSPIERFVIVFVDGVKVGLPMPEANEATVSQLSYKVAEVFDANGLLESYMQRSGLAVA